MTASAATFMPSTECRKRQRCSAGAVCGSISTKMSSASSMPNGYLPAETPRPRSIGSRRRSCAARRCLGTSASSRRRPQTWSRPSGRSSSVTAASSMRSVANVGTSATDWVASLSPWPEEFGLDRMRELLGRLGDPQTAYPAIHVVGTNGKSTATRTIAELLRAQGLRVGAYTSPHVSGWHERLDCDPATFERAVAWVRAPAEKLGATQFEALTAAALVEFAEAGADVSVVDAEVGLLTNVALEHTEVLGDTVEQIAKEKLAVAHAARVVVTSDNRFENLLPGRARVVPGAAREAAEAFLGRPIGTEVVVSLPGRLERRGDEVWDGAHTPEAVDWLLERLPAREHVLCASILADKRVDELLERLAHAGRTLVATRSSNPRALPEGELAARAENHFGHVEAIADPHEALARARALGGPVLVTGSLYLLADLHS